LYSAHDSTIGPLLAGYKLLDGSWPPFASNIAIELFERTKPNPKTSECDNHFVRVRYLNKPMKLPECEKEAIGDGTYCPLSRFEEISSQFIPKNYQEECEVPKEEK